MLIGDLISSFRQQFYFQMLHACLSPYLSVNNSKTLHITLWKSYFNSLHKKAKAAADVDYPAYGVTGPYAGGHKDSSPSGDNRLAQSAQMYHYQHQKQQIIAMENHNNVDKNGPHSEAESEDENEEGDYTVYECPGLAPVCLTEN